MEMEKSCEFCLLLRPIVYCKADAAHLCLSCDAKVHSANTLSNRHPRTIVCEMCRNRPAFVQCFQHQMFICRGCDCAQHDLSSQHQRKVICSFVGCPSAKDFAALWGFDLNEFDALTLQDQSTLKLDATVDKGVDIFDLPIQSCSGEGLSSISEVTSTVSVSPKVGSSRRKHPKGIVNTAKREDMNHILQQILDLKRLQLNQGTGTSYLTDQEEIDVSSFRFSTMWKQQDNLDQHLQHSLDLGSNLESLGSAPEKSAAESFPSLFSHLDGDAFWQCKSPAQNGQSWPQNMQDLGVCDDRVCFDDLSMPEVDLTFKNIEDLFGDEQEQDRALLDGKYTVCSSVENDFSLDKSYNGDDDRSTELAVFYKFLQYYCTQCARQGMQDNLSCSIDFYSIHDRTCQLLLLQFSCPVLLSTTRTLILWTMSITFITPVNVLLVPFIDLIPHYPSLGRVQKAVNKIPIVHLTWIVAKFTPRKMSYQGTKRRRKSGGEKNKRNMQLEKQKRR